MKNFIINLKAFILSNRTVTEKEISKILLRNALKVSTAESCTGGLISSRLTDITGSSSYLTANLVTYSNEAKQKFLNVSKETLETYGAVSEQCAREMAQGLMQLTKSDIVLCTTGVAGPSSSENKPVGLIYIACGYNDFVTVKEVKLDGNYNRKNMKFMFSEAALNMLLDTLKSLNLE